MPLSKHALTTLSIFLSPIQRATDAQPSKISTFGCPDLSCRLDGDETYNATRASPRKRTPVLSRSQTFFIPHRIGTTQSRACRRSPKTQPYSSR
ncbi:hypothetical protein BDV10DRAFT_174059 [Aspergillus recurvatus]